MGRAAVSLTIGFRRHLFFGEVKLAKGRIREEKEIKYWGGKKGTVQGGGGTALWDV